jgi:hypothetical protein
MRQAARFRDVGKKTDIDEIEFHMSIHASLKHKIAPADVLRNRFCDHGGSQAGVFDAVELAAHRVGAVSPRCGDEKMKVAALGRRSPVHTA